MVSEKTSEWMTKLIEKGEDVEVVMNFLREMSDKETKNAERELERREKDRGLEF